MEVLRLELPATHESVRVARHVLLHFARLRGVEDAERDTLALVASELLSNAVDHGGGQAAMDETELSNGARMDLEVEIGGGGWTLAVSDQGGGDPESLRALLAESALPDMEDDRGRGLYLMRSAVDRLEVARSADGRGLKIVAVRGHAGRSGG